MRFVWNDSMMKNLTIFLFSEYQVVYISLDKALHQDRNALVLCFLHQFLY